MKARHSSLDRISDLPSSIIENILCLVPIKEAARTSILSREWRYKWIKIPKLVFIENMFEMSSNDDLQSDVYERKTMMTRRCMFFYAIYQVMLAHQGPILDFTLVMDADETCFEIDQIINHLSRKNTVKIFRLVLNESFGYRLPLSIFSLHQLTHLYLYKGDVYPHPPFGEFANLIYLYLNDINMPTKTLLHLLLSCPVLKTLTLLIHEDNVLDYDKSTLIELFKCFSVLENLTTSTWVTHCFNLEAVPQELPTSLVNLKYLCVEEMCLFDSSGLPFVFLMIRSSPNLAKLSLEIYVSSATDQDVIEYLKEDPFTFDQYSDIWLGHLKELEIVYFVNLPHLLDFVKLILIKSPLLKKVSIWLYNGVTKDEESKIWKVLLSSPRASPLVKFMVER